MGTLLDPDATLVDLTAVKNYLNIPYDDATQDAKLGMFISAVRPLVEAITGPILLQQFEEWHDGGSTFIMVNRRPSTTYGTTPVLTVQAISEYNGPIEWPLAIIASPDEGQLYSAQPEVQFGRIVRRTAGGGVQAFPDQPQAVHVWYTVGQDSVPDNVALGTLELIRIQFQHTQQGRPRPGSNAVDEGLPEREIFGFFVPNSVRELLSPNKRHPSLA
jgi:hypothetical protein